MTTATKCREGRKPVASDRMRTPMMISIEQRHRAWLQDEAIRQDVAMSHLIRELLEREMAK